MSIEFMKDVRLFNIIKLLRDSNKASCWKALVCEESKKIFSRNECRNNLNFPTGEIF
jgi:hypothetical protein